MPTRKQRRRREKTFRHDYDLVVSDEEGNEVSLDRSELRAKREERQKPRQEARAKASKSPGGRGRTVRDPDPPSWSRALRRGGLFGIPFVLVAILLFHNMPLAARVGLGVIYAGLLIPFTYWVDRFAYRRFERRRDGAPRSARGR